MKKIKYLVLLLLLMPFAVNAVSGSENYYYGPYEWTFEDNVLTIKGTGDSVILSGANHQWNDYIPDIKKIVLEGVDVVNQHNFENYPNLEEVVLSNDMAGEIADYAFYNCPKLDHIELPSSGLSRIGKYAFYGTSIKEVEIPIFLSWVDEKAFPDDTDIIYKKDELNILDAGTAGNVLKEHSDYSFPGEGKESDNTCYNHYYFGKYYDNTAKWILYNDGTLLVYGTDLFTGYRNSRNPWGCYKKQIKKIIINNDKTGTINVEDACCKKGNNYKLAVYASKPVEEIMDNRIKNLSGSLFWDCREDCKLSSFNVNAIVINRGVENIDGVFLSNQEMVDRDFYIDKYVKNIDDSSTFRTDSNNPTKTTLHVNVSVEDYINNDYSYKAIGNDYSGTNAVDILDGNHFITNPEFALSGFSGEIINDIDDTYVSINDESAPDTIQVDGKTYYKYETFITNNSREISVSLPIDDSVDYYVKEIESPSGCSLKDDVVGVDMSNPTINLTLKHPSSCELIDNPQTSYNILIKYALLLLSLGMIVWSFKRKKV